MTSQIDQTTTDAPDPHRTDAITHVERRRAMLERLAVIGMRLAEEIGERAINSPYYPEPWHEPGRA